MGNHLETVAEIALVSRVCSIPRGTYESAPLVGCLELAVLHGVRHIVHGCRRIEVRINGHELVVVVLVGMLIGRGVRGVIHARTERRIIKVLILVIKPKGVPGFLTHHQIPPRGSVVLGRIEIGVIHFDGSLGDVQSIDPDLRDTEPAVAAVGRVANLVAP